MPAARGVGPCPDSTPPPSRDIAGSRAGLPPPPGGAAAASAAANPRHALLEGLADAKYFCVEENAWGFSGAAVGGKIGNGRGGEEDAWGFLGAMPAR